MADLPYPGIYCAQALTGGNHADGTAFTPSTIYDYSFSLQNVTATTTLYFDNVRTLTPASMSGIVNQYGQSTLTTWPGKAAQDSDLTAQAAAEQSDLAQNPGPAERDQYGGWADGPILKATGWFRTAYYRNRWWLVTPSGHLFFTLGMDSVRALDPTFTSYTSAPAGTLDRTNWFRYLPVSPDPLTAFISTYSTGSGPADTSGNTFDFFQANIYRKYGGTASASQWITTSVQRLQSWGFNTLGIDSDTTTYDRGTPATVKIIPSGGGTAYKIISTGSGHGDQMPDPWDPNYVPALDAALAQVVPTVINDPYFLGYYIDNELSFAGNGTYGRYALVLQVFTQPTTGSYPSPAKQVFVTMLQTKYSTVTNLNTAWGTSFTNWNSVSAGFNLLTLTPTPTQTCLADLSNLTLALCTKYFQTVLTELKQPSMDPHHLYLGCRFSYNYLVPEAVQACAQYADVVSLNIYEPQLTAGEWGYLSGYNKPFMIGEFHMGADDSGSFSPGLVAAQNQTTRAALFQSYVNSALSLPAFVGVNWYQYEDQPVTGIDVNGENGNIGFVSITDNPYPAMVAAARATSQGMYAYRSNATSVTVAPATAYSGAIVNLSAILTRQDTGAFLQGKTVTFSIAGAAIGTGTTFSRGDAYLNYAIPAGTAAGTPTVTATFAGDAGDSPSNGANTLTVAILPTVLTISNATGATGGPAVMKATLLYQLDSKPVVNQMVKFAVAGQTLTTTGTTDSTGTATASFPIKSGTGTGSYLITGTFAGDPADAASSAMANLTVTTVPVVMTVPTITAAAGTNTTLTATMTRSDTGAGLGNFTVTFKVGASTVGSATTASNGSANYHNYPVSGTMAGNNTVTATFAGTAPLYPSASGSGTLKVTATSTQISVAAASGKPGTKVTLAAMLTFGSTNVKIAGKTVTFLINGVSQGTALTYSTGQAFLDYTIPSGTPAGTETITVKYPGDTYDAPATAINTLTVTATPSPGTKQVIFRRRALPGGSKLPMTQRGLRSAHRGAANGFHTRKTRAVQIGNRKVGGVIEPGI